MYSEEKTVLLLNRLGCTDVQSNIYLVLLKLGKSSARDISKNSRVHRTGVYRGLQELEEMGLVEKEIGAPHKFVATPIQCGLEILLAKQSEQNLANRKIVNKFLRTIPKAIAEIPKQREYRITMLEGKIRLQQKIESQHINAQKTVDILTTSQRWLQILDFNLKNYEKAVKRGVNYRIVLENSSFKMTFQEKVQALLERPNFEMRHSRCPLTTNAAIIDKKEVTINFFPGKPLGESPIVCTNHPSFISMCQDQFDKVWKSSQKYEIQNNASVL